MSILESRPLRLGRNVKHYIAHLLLYYLVYSISVKYLCGLNQYFSEWEHITFWGGPFFLWRVWSIGKFLLLNKISLWQIWVAASLQVFAWWLSDPYMVTVESFLLHVCLESIDLSTAYCFDFFSPPLSLSSGHCCWCILC